MNKLWNASRFVHMSIPNTDSIFKEKELSKIEEKLIENYDNLMFHEKWILSRLKYL
jgi:valyl-tRNA synthetase